jgi:hypothetical protein
MRLWWWRKIRKANIPDEERDVLERYGETVIALMITSGLGPRSEVLSKLYFDPEKLKRAEEWLTERSDSNEQREQRLETLEWAILLLIALELPAVFGFLSSSVVQLWHKAIAHWPRS